MKKSREKGLSFTYVRDGKVLHCGVVSKEEWDKLGNCPNPLAPTDADVVDNVYYKNARIPYLDKLTLRQLKTCIKAVQ